MPACVTDNEDNQHTTGSLGLGGHYLSMSFNMQKLRKLINECPDLTLSSSA